PNISTTSWTFPPTPPAGYRWPIGNAQASRPSRRKNSNTAAPAGTARADVPGHAVDDRGTAPGAVDRHARPPRPLPPPTRPRGRTPATTTRQQRVRTTLRRTVDGGGDVAVPARRPAPRPARPTPTIQRPRQTEDMRTWGQHRRRSRRRAHRSTQPIRDDSAGSTPALRSPWHRRRDRLIAALLAVCCLVAGLLVWAYSDARATKSHTAPAAGPPSVPDQVPETLRPAWQAASSATDGPLAVGPTVVTAVGGTVRGRDARSGEVRWKYTRDQIGRASGRDSVERCAAGARRA